MIALWERHAKSCPWQHCGTRESGQGNRDTGAPKHQGERAGEQTQAPKSCMWEAGAAGAKLSRQVVAGGHRRHGSGWERGPRVHRPAPRVVALHEAQEADVHAVRRGSPRARNLHESTGQRHSSMVARQHGGTAARQHGVTYCVAAGQRWCFPLGVHLGGEHVEVAAAVVRAEVAVDAVLWVRELLVVAGAAHVSHVPALHALEVEHCHNGLPNLEAPWQRLVVANAANRVAHSKQHSKAANSEYHTKQDSTGDLLTCRRTWTGNMDRQMQRSPADMT